MRMRSRNKTINNTSAVAHLVNMTTGQTLVVGPVFFYLPGIDELSGKMTASFP
jgi:hypothetical protein